MQKVRRHDSKTIAPTACKRMVSGTISLPLRGTFHLSLTVLVHYRSPLVFSLAGWSPRIRSGFHVSGSTQVPTGESHEFRLRASNPLRMAFPDHSATRAICNSPADLRDGQVGPTTPAAQRPQAFTQQVWAISPFARHYSGNREFLSFPPGTQMYHFPRFPPPALCVQTGGDTALPVPGFPIRSSVLQSPLAAPHGLSQLATTFIGYPVPRHPPYALTILMVLDRAMQFSKIR